jgi:hypothetical protein
VHACGGSGGDRGACIAPVQLPAAGSIPRRACGRGRLGFFLPDAFLPGTPILNAGAGDEGGGYGRVCLMVPGCVQKRVEWLRGAWEACSFVFCRKKAFLLSAPCGPGTMVTPFNQRFWTGLITASGPRGAQELPQLPPTWGPPHRANPFTPKAAFSTARGASQPPRYLSHERAVCAQPHWLSGQHQRAPAAPGRPQRPHLGALGASQAQCGRPSARRGWHAGHAVQVGGSSRSRAPPPCATCVRRKPPRCCCSCMKTPSSPALQGLLGEHPVPFLPQRRL